MPDLVEHTVELAKRNKYSRSELYAKICTFAEQRRMPGESTAQAFTKFVTGEGAELMQVHSALGAAGSGDIVPDHAASSPPAPVTKSGSGEWHMLVDLCKRAHKREHPHTTESQANAAAVSAAVSTPEGLHLFQMQKRAEQAASGLFTADDLECLDKAQPAPADVHIPASGHEFEALVNNAMSQHGLTRSAAMDHIRTTKPDAWTAYKGKPGQNGAQGDTATTGRAGAQWSSDHSGAEAVTPSRVPAPADQTPAIKQWNDLKRRAMFNYGYSEAKTVEILKLLPQGRRAIAAVIEEARAIVARA
jgi:hypothetical protein